jgi:hypothetical protein
VETNKEKFLRYYSWITRPGSEELLNYIKGTDFFTAPASTRYHGNHEGGLVEHSVNVYERLSASAKNHTAETVAIVALLHDLCKANFYKMDFRNVKQPDGSWVRVPYYAVEDKLPIGNHADKSVFIIQKFMKLTDEEIAAIRYHMAAFQEGDIKGFGTACEKYPLTVLIHVADMEATYFDDKVVKW